MPGIFGIIGDISRKIEFENAHLYLNNYKSNSITINDSVFLGKFDFDFCQTDIINIGDYFITMTGEYYSDNSIANSSLRGLYDLYLQHDLEFVNYIDGVYNIWIYNKKSKKLLIVNDWAGNHNLFYYINGSDLVFSTELKTILRVIPSYSVNRKALVQQCMFGHLLFNNTFINEIKLLDPATILEFSGKKVNQTRYFDLRDSYCIEESRKESYYIDKLYNLFEQPTLKYLHKDKMSLPLTGGMDSRFLLHFLLKHHYDIGDIFTGGHPKSEDVIIAKKICKALDLPHRKTKVPIKYFINNFKNNYRVHEGFLSPIYYESGLYEVKELGYNYLIQYPSINMTLGDLYTPNTANFIGNYQTDNTIINKIKEKFLKVSKDTLTSLFVDGTNYFEHTDIEVFNYFFKLKDYPSIFVFDYFAWYEHCRRWSNIGGMNGKFIGRVAPTQDKNLIVFCFNLPAQLKYWQYIHKKMFKIKCPELAKFPREGTGVPISWPEPIQMVFKAYRRKIKNKINRNVIPDQFADFFRFHVKNEIENILYSKIFIDRGIVNHKFAHHLWKNHLNGENNTYLMHNILNVELFFRNYID